MASIINNIINRVEMTLCVLVFVFILKFVMICFFAVVFPLKDFRFEFIATIKHDNHCF